MNLVLNALTEGIISQVLKEKTSLERRENFCRFLKNFTVFLLIPLNFICCFYLLLLCFRTIFFVLIQIEWSEGFVGSLDLRPNFWRYIILLDNSYWIYYLRNLSFFFFWWSLSFQNLEDIIFYFIFTLISVYRHPWQLFELRNSWSERGISWKKAVYYSFELFTQRYTLKLLLSVLPKQIFSVASEHLVRKHVLVSNNKRRSFSNKIE